VKTIVPVAIAAVAALSTGAQAQDCESSAPTPAGLVEVVRFRLAAQVNREDFVTAAADTMPALCATQGFIGRVLSEGEDGEWMDHIRWTDAQAAQAAMAGAMENEALLPFIRSIDPNRIVLSYQVPVVLK